MLERIIFHGESKTNIAESVPIMLQALTLTSIPEIFADASRQFFLKDLHETPPLFTCLIAFAVIYRRIPT
jgi:hypothetical protein